MAYDWQGLALPDRNDKRSNKMKTKVTFRAVGIYCYFPYLDLEKIDPLTSTVKDVMDAIQARDLGFSYTDKGGTVDTLSYTYSSLSTQPFNTLHAPPDGFRQEEEAIGSSVAFSWQYYRSISGTFPGDETLYEIKIANATYTQPKYGATLLSSGQQIPPGFKIFNYNLTWRLLRLQLSPSAAARRLESRSAA